jgi:hypothetical protein
MTALMSSQDPDDRCEFLRMLRKNVAVSTASAPTEVHHLIRTT